MGATDMGGGAVHSLGASDLRVGWGGGVLRRAGAARGISGTGSSFRVN